MLWILYYGCSALFLFFIVLDITWRLWKRKLSFLPSAPNIPWLGSVPYMGTDSHEFYKFRKSTSTRYNHMFVMWLGPTPMVRIGQVEYLEPLLRSQEIITKSVGYQVMKEWLGDGLLISTGKKWKKRRTALTGAFHFATLNDFVDIFEKHAISFVSKLHTIVSKEKEIEVQWLISLALLDVICDTSMGVSINALDSSDSEYVRAVRDLKTLMLRRLNNPFLTDKTIYQCTPSGKEYFKCLETLHNFTINVINENIGSNKDSSTNAKANGEEVADVSYMKRKKVFIDVLLDLFKKGEIDVDGIREEVDTFMFEGHDTTTSALSWTLYEIGRHPEIQAKVQEEIDSVSSNESSLMSKIRLLKYTESVIKESLRLHPPVPNYSRKLEKDVVINGNVFPSGTIMSVDTFSIHMNPAYWDEPTVFNPGRFVSDEKRHPYCYVPFSAGPRNCIGQKFAMLEEKVFLYFILSNFNIKSMQSPDEIKTGVDLVTHSVNGINIEFTARNLELPESLRM